MNLTGRHGLIERFIDHIPYGWGIAGFLLCVLLFIPLSLRRELRGKW
jgi:hypothetical protein